MMKLTYVRVFCSVAVLVSLVALPKEILAGAKTNVMPKIRVTKTVDETRRTSLYGHVPAALHRATKLGRVDPATRAEHLIMTLKSSPEQEKEIRRVIDEQQDKRTGNHHQWMQPEEFGEHFGVHDGDIAKVTAWLESHGLSVEKVTKAKRAIQFSGTSGQLEEAFQMEMHYFMLPDGDTHVSNDRDISVPEALNPVISGVPTLNDFFKKGHHTQPTPMSKRKPGPKYTNGSGNYVGPADFATIYNTQPLLANGINGKGVTIGIVGRSDIFLSDVQTYRQMFNLPVNDPVFIHAGDDAGVVIGDDSESDLDVEIAGGVAPNATIDFVIGPSSWLVDGVTLSTMYLVENNIADIISTSYGSCESTEGAGGNSFNQQMFEQAAAQGISVFVAAGDAGSAECDGSSDYFETGGYAATGEASTWYSVAVGGTEFNETGGSYWTANNANNEESALSYIPELPWNEAGGSDENFANYPGLTTSQEDCVYSGTAGYFTQDACNYGLWATAGGPSAYYLQPPWQTGSNVPTSDPTLPGGNWINLNLTNTNANGASGSGYTATPTVTLAGETCTVAASSSPTSSDGSAVPLVNVTLGDDITSADNGSVTGLSFNGYGLDLNSKGTSVSGFFFGQGWNCTAAGTATFTAAPAGGTTATATASLGQMYNMTPLVTGVPHRYTPDVSLNAAADHDGTVYCDEGSCQINPNGSIADADIVGGTSVAAPSMAGIQALINQANGGRQGMPAYMYYYLANQQFTASPTACNADGTGGPGSGCAFNDITVGDNLVCGTLSTNIYGNSGALAASCLASTPANKMGFTAAQGYDMATGLGSVNAANLSNQWKNITFNSSSFSAFNLSSTTFGFGSPVTISGTVASSAGTPTGDVAIIVSQGAIGDTYNTSTGALNGPVAFATLSGGNFSTTLNNLPGGTYYVTARYAGNQSANGGGTIASSLSPSVQVTVGQDSGTTVSVVSRAVPQGDLTCTTDYYYPTFGPATTFEYPNQIWFDATVTGASGTGAPTGTVTLSDSYNGGASSVIATLTLDPDGYAYGLEGVDPIYFNENCLLYQVEYANIPIFSAGTHIITAAYSGDNTFPASSTTMPQITVTPNADKLALAITPATDILAGQATQLTATITGDSSVNVGQPGGSGGFTLTAAANASSGTTTYTGTFTGATTGSLVGNTFVIGGFLNGNNNGSFTVTANTGATTITVNNAGGIAQSCSSGCTAVGWAGNGTINGNATGILAAFQNVAPVGTVTFTDTTTSTTLCSAAPVISGAVTYVASGQTYYYPTAFCTTAGITGATGSHTVSAAFSPTNSNYAASSGTKSVTILAASAAASTTTVVTSNSNPSVLYPPPSLTATVTGPAGGSSPTSGAVTFYDGTTVLGTATVGAAHTATLSTAYNSSGTGLGVSRIFGAGTHNITASWAGSGTSTGTAVNLTSAAISNGTTTVYTGNIPNTAPCAAGGATYYTVALFSASVDNGTFSCASISPGNPGTLTLNNPAGVASTPGLTSLALTAAAAASGSNTTYTGTVTGGSTSCFGNVGVSVTIAGFANSANNGTFPCVSTTTTTITVANSAGVAQNMVSGLTAAAAAVGGNTTYTGTIVAGTVSGQYTGTTFTVAGFKSSGSGSCSGCNGTFPYVSSTATTLTLVNSGGKAITGTATATPNNVTASYSGNPATATYGGGTFVGNTSPVFQQVVNVGPTVNWLSAKTVGEAGQSYTFSSVIDACGAAFTSVGPPPVCPAADTLPYGPSDTGITQSNGGIQGIGTGYIDYIPYQPTGNVQFFLDGNSIGSAPLTSEAAYPNGGSQIYLASLTVSNLTTGTHLLTSTYPSDGNFAASTSETQAVYVGNASQTSGIYTPVAGTVLPNTGGVPFEWFAAPGATAYWLDIGSAQGGNQFYTTGGPVNSLLETVQANWPTNGTTVWARLYTLIGGNWTYTDYQYATLNSANYAQLTYPTPSGSSVPGSSVTFSWQAGANSPAASAYWVDIGSTVGGNQYLQSGSLSSNTFSVTAIGLPQDGSEFFVTLYSYVNGQWLSNSYNFYSSSQSSCLATINAPAQGSTLNAYTQLVSWTPSSAPGCSSSVTNYWLDAGTTTSENFYFQSGPLGLVTSATAYNIPPLANNNNPPPNWEVEMTLWNLINGVWVASPEVGYCAYGYAGYPTCSAIPGQKNGPGHEGHKN